MPRKKGNSHTLNPKYSVTQAGAMLVQYSCPSGCVKGYFWGNDHEAIRDTFRVIQDDHRKRHLEETDEQAEDLLRL